MTRQQRQGLRALTGKDLRDPRNDGCVKLIAFDCMEDAVMSRPSRGRPSPRQVIAKLDSWHQEVDLRLQQLRMVAASPLASSANESARVQARELIEFFTGPVRKHNDDQERLVFPSLLAGSDGHVHRIVERLREEHAWIELQWLDIEAQLAALTQSEPIGDGRALVGASDEFALLMNDHMALERSTIELWANSGSSDHNRGTCQAARRELDL